MSGQFEEWLKDRLKGVECDTGVLLPYVVSILQEEEDETELKDSIESILESMIDPSASVNILQSTEIIEKWQSLVSKGETDLPPKGPMDLQAAMSEIAESKSSAYRDSIKKGPSNTDAAVKAAILAGYSQEEDDLDIGDEDQNGDDDLFCRNSNAEGVAKAEFDKREKARASAAAKKEKDREDCENQRKSHEERKKKAQEKAAKGERRR
uniref:Coiled-coil domain-containing protein 43 n=1 Tax=Lepeophtheirus salmonis TaxID=72036 RepID=C1BSU9_LEPSM|nr:Coiled-coil domain-containing protein 43 [Lepeophtheirus salmonis]